MLLDIEQKIVNRLIERNTPGLTQQTMLENGLLMFGADGVSTVEV